MPKTMAYRVVGSLFIVVHTADNPTTEEWSDYLDYYLKTAHLMSTLVVTDGGGPNTGQRATMNKHIESDDVKPSVAICTDNRITRGVVTALSWFNSSVRAFSKEKEQIEEALRYLGVGNRAAMAAALDMIQTLQGELTESKSA